MHVWYLYLLRLIVNKVDSIIIKERFINWWVGILKRSDRVKWGAILDFKEIVRSSVIEFQIKLDLNACYIIHLRYRIKSWEKYHGQKDEK